jgi:hypothetical protein
LYAAKVRAIYAFGSRESNRERSPAADQAKSTDLMEYLKNGRMACQKKMGKMSIAVCRFNSESI